ncbi:NADP-dependent oxidoreductase [Pseudonocardia sp. CA-107938]|uniref:NADP-dependent oxidoreductase n=1 Tax=Pseudonocardia sp. CA-107938 TaxID=3240021 RepID=UPI003D91D794
MRAVVVDEPGGPDAAVLVEVAVPEPGPGQVRIRVRAAAVNPVDGFVRSGAATAAGLVVPRDRLGLGWDVAGEIDAIGDGVAGFAVGDAVIGLADRLDVPTAAYAEWIVLDADAVAPAPAGWSAVEAATLPLNALTAAQALDVLDLVAGSTALVTGAAGAVGGYAVELAVAAGLRVVAVAGADDEKLVRSLGAERFVPRDAERLGAAVRAQVPGGVDGVLDAAVVGVAAHDALRGGGAFVSVHLGSAPPPLRGSRVTRVAVRADGRRLRQLSELAAAGRLTARVADVLPLAQAAEAHRRLADGGLRGRLVLTP